MKALKNIGRVILAGITAAAVLSALLFLYDILPVHSENPKGNTDYVWQPNSVWVKLTEGISWGKFDADGFNNPKVIENPDILILGSSHMEATNVFYRESLGCLLPEKLNNRYSVYNLGISGHNFYKVCQYLPVNLKLYSPAPKIAVIETSKVGMTADRVSKIISHKVARSQSPTSGLIGLLQKIPVFRSLYHQYARGLLNIFMPKSTAPAASADDDDDLAGDDPAGEVDEAAYDTFFSYLAELEKESGTQLIIFYHPRETLTESGGIAFASSSYLAAFSRYAEKYHIDFIDMTVPFEEMYAKEHLVPHGFVTGRLCEGHLNANGHRAVADELANVIERLEKEDALCK